VHKAWDITIVPKLERVSRQDTEEILLKAKAQQPTGQIKCFGQAKVVQQKDHLSLKNMYEELKGENNASERNQTLVR